MPYLRTSAQGMCMSKRCSLETADEAKWIMGQEQTYGSGQGAHWRVWVKERG